MEKVNIGIVGCGGIAGAHLRGLTQLYEGGYRDFAVTACCDLEEARASAMAEKYEAVLGIKPAVYTDYREMLEKETSMDAITIYTTHENHHDIAIAAMESGRHVTTEKPLGFTLRAARQIMDKAEETGMLLHVAENYRMAPAERAVNWAIASGRIGEPRLLNWMDIGERRWYWQWRDHLRIASGGWTIDGGVHFSDLWQLHIGEIQRVTAVSKVFDPVRYISYKSVEEFEEAQKKELPRYRPTRSLKHIDPNELKEPVDADVEDTTSAILEFSNGVIGTWVVSRSAPGRVDRSCVLYGSDGSLAWNEGIFAREGQAGSMGWQEMIDAYMESLTPDERERLFPMGITDTMAIEDKQFIDTVLGRGRFEVDAWTGYKAMAVPMAVYESAAVRQPVLLQDVLDLKIEAYQKPLNETIGL